VGMRISKRELRLGRMTECDQGTGKQNQDGESHYRT